MLVSHRPEQIIFTHNGAHFSYLHRPTVPIISDFRYPTIEPYRPTIGPEMCCKLFRSRPLLRFTHYLQELCHARGEHVTRQFEGMPYGKCICRARWSSTMPYLRILRHLLSSLQPIPEDVKWPTLSPLPFANIRSRKDLERAM